MEVIRSLNILLADDDRDDRLFFSDALEELSVSTSLITVNDGEQLMEHLENELNDIPDILFLDLNMPRKNGFECLIEIKQHPLLKKLPVIIYSTSYDEEKAVQLLRNGAHLYICKPAEFNELKNVIHQALIMVHVHNVKPTKDIFLVTKTNTFY